MRSRQLIVLLTFAVYIIWTYIAPHLTYYTVHVSHRVKV